MIGFVRGILVDKAPPILSIDVHGVGYELEAPMSTFYNLPPPGGEIKLFTHLVVREDAHILFGFSTETDRSLFRALIKVNGVGPRLALTLLSGLNSEQFTRCIQENDVQTLVRLPGVGKKTAERLIIELRDRLPSADVSALPLEGLNVLPGSGSAKQEAVSALCALGYKPQDAVKMVQAVTGNDKSCEEVIRLALQGAAR